MAKTIKVTKEQLLQYINNKYTIWQIIEELNCCKNTIKNKLEKFNIKAPKGFYITGKSIGSLNFVINLLG